MRLLPRSDGAIAALLSAAAVLLYELSALGRPTSFDYSGRLAQAFLEGRWWLTEAPEHLVELVPCGMDRYCVAYPPTPAVVAMPFVLLFAPWTAQTVASAVAGGLSAGPTYLAMRALGTPNRAAITVTIFAIAGTTLWFTASTGDAWFFAHAVAVLFSAFAVLAAVRGWPAWSVGALIGAAALARFPVVLALPALAFVVRERRGGSLVTTLASASAGAAPFVLLELVYDLMRWGVPSEAGYAYLSSSENPVTPFGLFSLRYVPAHLYAIFLQPPAIGGAPFVIRPSRWGESLLLLSPAYLYLVPALGRVRAAPVYGALLAAGAFALVPDLLHGGVGARQLGYRFSLDAQPFLLPLLALGASPQGGGRSRALFAAVGWSVLANAYGVLAIAAVGYG